jgi:hypothetical protein
VLLIGDHATTSVRKDAAAKLRSRTDDRSHLSIRLRFAVPSPLVLEARDFVTSSRRLFALPSSGLRKTH